MKLWLLRPIREQENDPWIPWYDKIFGFVIRAETEQHARIAADNNGGNENSRDMRPWLNPDYSTCAELIADGPAEVIIYEYKAA